MVIISKTILVDFGQRHLDAVNPLNDWWKKSKEANWTSFHDVKKTFNTTDFAGNDRYVFDIKNNKYRIVAMIHFDIRTVYIRFVGTHKEYDHIAR